MVTVNWQFINHIADYLNCECWLHEVYLSISLQCTDDQVVQWFLYGQLRHTLTDHRAVISMWTHISTTTLAVYVCSLGVLLICVLRSRTPWTVFNFPSTQINAYTSPFHSPGIKIHNSYHACTTTMSMPNKLNTHTKTHNFTILVLRAFHINIRAVPFYNRAEYACRKIMLGYLCVQFYILTYKYIYVAWKWYCKNMTTRTEQLMYKNNYY